MCPVPFSDARFMASAPEQLLFDNGAYRLTATRLEQPGLVAELVSPGCLRITREAESRELSIPMAPPAGCAGMRSSIPVLQAMYALAAQELQADIDAEGHLLAGANWSSVWTRDVAFSAALGTALAAPEATRRSLESRVRNGVVMQDTGTGGGWPVSTDRVSWALGAWALYEVQGDTKWLAWCVDVLKATLEQDAAVMPEDEVLRPGETSFIDWREQSYPDWMTPADIASSYAFGTNVLHYLCRQLLARMLRELDRDKEAAVYAAAASRLAAEIQEEFWSAGSCHYGMMRTAEGYLDDRVDSLATSLAVLCGLAGEHAATALQHLPRSPFGTPVFTPYKSRQEKAYHNRAVWPFVEAYVLLAQADLQNASGASFSMSALLRAAMAFGTNKENFHAETGAAEQTIQNSDRQLWSVAGMLGMFYYAVFGIKFEGDNLVIQPCVPREYRGSHWLTGLRIRDMVLDIHVNGYGTEICSVMVNGHPDSPIIPLDASGRIQIELELMPVEDEAEQLPVPRAVEDLPEPEWDNPSARLLRWHPVPGAASYNVFRNGVAFSATLDCQCSLPPGRAYYNEYTVQAVNEVTTSCFSRPFECPASGCRVELRPVRVGEQAEFDVEQEQAWLDTRPCTARLDYEDTVLAAGIYAVRVHYCNATASLRDSDTCALRELLVNGESAGIILLPHNTEAGQWENYTRSAALQLTLPAGNHRFSLCFTPRCTNANGETNQCMVRQLEITRIA